MSPAWHPGAWQYNHQLGKGAFKDVYKGFDEEEGIEVAWCQVIMDRVGETERAQIKDEVELLKGLTHQNILTFIDEVDPLNTAQVFLTFSFQFSSTYVLNVFPPCMFPFRYVHMCRLLL